MTKKPVTWLHNFRRMFVLASVMTAQFVPPRPRARPRRSNQTGNRGRGRGRERGRKYEVLDKRRGLRQTFFARACGVWTYEPRQGRKAATAVCFAIAAVTLAPFHFRFMIAD